MRGPLAMESSIDVVHPRRVALMSLRPGVAEAHEVVAAALCTRAVAGGESGRLVQEEQLGELAGAQELPAPSLELEPAGDPSTALPLADQSAVVVVQDAPVPEQKPSCFRRDDFPERRDPVASRHGVPS
jgi:hypothetical protein